jgi:pimeloyl-ACP methyl ester carboxylesterase
MSALPNIVLVHGAWADGSSWSAVTERLQADGYTVTAPQFPMSALADDVARLRQVLARQHGPTVVAGHSYGGQIITALGTDAPNVVGLVYIAGFGLDEGESIGALLGQAPPTSALAHLDIDPQSSAWLPEDDFVNHFAADVDPVKTQRQFAGRMGATTVEVPTNHVAMVSHPDDVLNLITTAAHAVPTAT